MHKIIFLLGLLFILSQADGQAPQAISYQAAARDVDNSPIKNREIAIRLTIRKGNIQGEVVYRELHEPKTSDLGIFSFSIGDGNAALGAFELIEWGNDDFFLEVEMDADRDGAFTLMGISQFISVPYALYADRAGSADDDMDTSPENEIQTLEYNEFTNELSLSGANAVLLPAIPLNNDDDSTNELQSLALDGTEITISDGNTIDLADLGSIFNTDNQILSIVGTNLVISGGNSIDLSLIQDGVDDADNDPNNERIQAMFLNNATLNLVEGGTIQSVDLSNAINQVAEDNQNLTLIGNNLFIEDGNNVDLSGIIPAGSTDNQQLFLNGTSLMIEDGNTVNLSVLQDGVNDADSDPNNELQDLQLNGTVLEISSGNNVDLSGIIPPGGTDDQELILNGTNLMIEDGNTVNLSVLQDGVNDADSDPNNELQDLQLNGTVLEISSGNNVDLSGIIPPGGTDDQHLFLSGTSLLIEDGNAVNLSVLQDGVNDADSDPNNELQDLQLNGTVLEISSGNNVDLSGIIPPGGTDDQHLFLSGTSLLIEDGNAVDLSVLQDGVNDADSDPNNEKISGLFLNNSVLSIVEGGDVQSIDLSSTQNSVWEVNLDTAIYSQGDVRIVNSLLVDDEIYLENGANPYIRLAAPSDDVVQTPWGMDIFTTTGTNAISLSADWLGSNISLHSNTPSNQSLISLNSYNPYGGFFTIANTQGAARVYNNVTDVDNGILTTFGTNGNTNVQIASYNNAPNYGVVSVHNQNGARLVDVGVTNEVAGYLASYGENLQLNSIITHITNFPDHGAIGVFGVDGNSISTVPEAHMYVDANGMGRIEADIKNFVTDHPNDPTKEIVYTSLEGPEAGAYERGTATLVNGEVFVEFSEHFSLIINHSSLTVNLTPLSTNTYGLAVVEKTQNGFRVKELMNRQGNFSFDWEVKAVRKGFENIEVIREKGKNVPVRNTSELQINKPLEGN